MPNANRWASDTITHLRRTPACYTDAMNDEHPTPPPHGHGLAYTLIGIFLAALVFGAWGVWTLFAPRPGDATARLRAQGERIELLEQQVATLKRSDQVSREAN